MEPPVSEENCSPRCQLRVVVGRAQLDRKQSDRLGPGALVTLDDAVEEPVEVFADGRLVAKGELVVVEGVFGVRVDQVVA